MMRVTVLFVLALSTAFSFLYSSPLEIEEVTLLASHRIYKKYQEEFTVKLGERFLLSDTEFSAEAVEFIPDFAINVEKKEVISRSDEPNNPAVRVLIYKDGEQVDDVWTFQGKGAPHFYRESLIAFVIVDFKIKTSSSPDATDESESREDTAPMTEKDSDDERGDSDE